MNTDELTPMISMSAKSNSSIALSDVVWFTTNLRGSDSDFYASLRGALMDKNFKLEKMCLIWVVAISEFSEACTLYFDSGELYDFDFGPKGISAWTERTKDTESAESIGLGNSYFNQYGK